MAFDPEEFDATAALRAVDNRLTEVTCCKIMYMIEQNLELDDIVELLDLEDRADDVKTVYVQYLSFIS